MEIFFRFLFGHLLADFTFQTNYIADWKRRSFLGLLVHVAIHPICYLFTVWPYLKVPWMSLINVPVVGWQVIVIATFLHFLEDWFRITMVNRGWRDNTIFYTWDQVVHISIIWALSPVTTQAVINLWPILGALFVVVTHCATVTVWFIEKDFKGVDYPETEEKYISMIQRLVLWLAFFLPTPWWIFVIGFIVFTFGRHVYARRIDFSLTSVLLGQFITLGCGSISRFLLNFHF